MLVTNTLFNGTVDKVKIAIDRLRQFCPPDGYEVANSGGKDSEVIISLCKEAGIKHQQWHNLTTVDSPETIYHLRDNHPECNIRRPEKTMWKLVVENRMPPTRQARYCCASQKERGGFGGVVVLGVRAAESAARKRRQMVEACMKPGNNRNFVNPIIDWTDDEVWEYIDHMGLKVNPLYSEGRKRVGCVGCPMYDQRKDIKRWPKLMDNWYRAVCRCYDQAKKDGLADKWLREKGDKAWKSGDELWEWWISNRSKKADPDQMTIFE